MEKNFETITKEFKQEFGFDFLKQTRKREYIEARSVLISYFYHYRNMGLTEIARKIGSVSDWKPNHATIYHALKQYDVYTKYNKNLDAILKKVIGVASISDMKTYIQHTISNLDDSTVYVIFKTAAETYAKKLDQIESTKTEVVDNFQNKQINSL
tara:strand:- start:93 stop:557 length:465 start_codon:yes stop_codon:yes gene_type:complete